MNPSPSTHTSSAFLNLREIPKVIVTQKNTGQRGKSNMFAGDISFSVFYRFVEKIAQFYTILKIVVAGKIMLHFTSSVSFWQHP